MNGYERFCFNLIGHTLKEKRGTSSAFAKTWWEPG